MVDRFPGDGIDLRFFFFDRPIVAVVPSSWSHFAIDEPLTLAVIHILHGSIVVYIEDLTRLHFDTEIEPAHV